MIRTLLMLALLSGSALAQEAVVVPPPTETIAMVEGGGALVKLGSPATSLFIADSCIADVQAVSESLAFVTAQNAGQTSFFALNAAEEVVASFRVTVLRVDRRSIAIEELRETPEGVVEENPC